MRLAIDKSIFAIYIFNNFRVNFSYFAEGSHFPRGMPE